MKAAAPRTFTLPILATVAALCACSSGTVVLRSNHYRLVVPAEWQAAEQGGVATLYLPPSGGAPAAGRLEIRLQAWLMDRIADDPVQMIARRLAESEDASPVPATDTAFAACGEPVRRFRVFGAFQTAVNMRSRSGGYLIVTAGQSSDSLVAIVGAVPNQPPLCENLAAMNAAIAKLGTSLSPAGDPTRPRPFPDVTPSPLPGRAPYDPPVPALLP